MNEDRWKIDWYSNWLESEGVSVVSGSAIDLTSVETAYWPRLGTNAAIVHLDARGDFCNLYVTDVVAGGTSTPIRHMYEHLVYVLDGRGSTVIQTGSGIRREFEWQRGSLFSIPLNARYQHFNASGENRARLINVSSMPLILNMFRNEDFAFNADFEFPERMGEEKFLSGDGNFIETREHRHHWETNLVPNLLTFDQLSRLSRTRHREQEPQFVLGDGTLHCHASDIPIGNYKKAHYHGEGYHIMQLSGVGYSLYWYDNEEPIRSTGSTAFSTPRAPASGTSTSMSAMCRRATWRRASAASATRCWPTSTTPWRATTARAASSRSSTPTRIPRSDSASRKSAQTSQRPRQRRPRLMGGTGSKFMSIPIKKGEIVRERVSIGELADGTPIALPVMTVGGVHDGPTLYLQAGIHGDESTGMEVCRRARPTSTPGSSPGSSSRCRRPIFPRT